MKKIITAIALFAVIGLSGYAFAGDNMTSFQYKEHNDRDFLEVTYWEDRTVNEAVPVAQIPEAEYKELNDRNFLEVAYFGHDAMESHSAGNSIQLALCVENSELNDRDFLNKSYGIRVNDTRENC